MISEEKILDMSLQEIREYVDEHPEDGLIISSVLRGVAVKCSFNNMKNIFEANK